MKRPPSPLRDGSLSLLVSLALIIVPCSQAATVPEGLSVYGELDDQVTSKKKETTVGDVVRAHVWRDVLVDGQIVIKAGTPMITKVSVAKPAKIAGRKGDLELGAVSTRAVDGTEVFLDGGYDKSGGGRKGLAWSLFALVAWPLIFIKGKQAVLDPGTVFDAAVMGQVEVTLPGAERAGPRKLDLTGLTQNSLTASVLYDDIDPEAKNVHLPMRMRRCQGTLAGAQIVSVNGADVPPMTLEFDVITDDEDCQAGVGTVNLKELAKSFRRGINRFNVEADGATTEVVLDIEF